ncbi:hypothetical protein LY76DRAFT_204612 [Colletotrichum caudatum]|nr:hypothetical protein LY76DRAFT_204612 [Colletotrichum caudatum]
MAEASVSFHITGALDDWLAGWLPVQAPKQTTVNGLRAHFETINCVKRQGHQRACRRCLPACSRLDAWASLMHKKKKKKRLLFRPVSHSCLEMARCLRLVQVNGKGVDVQSYATGNLLLPSVSKEPVVVQRRLEQVMKLVSVCRHVERRDGITQAGTVRAHFLGRGGLFSEA